MYRYARFKRPRNCVRRASGLVLTRYAEISRQTASLVSIRVSRHCWTDIIESKRKYESAWWSMMPKRWIDTSEAECVSVRHNPPTFDKTLCRREMPRRICILYH
jgi:hypothetical protein